MQVKVPSRSCPVGRLLVLVPFGPNAYSMYGLPVGAAQVVAAKAPLACCHFSKKTRMSAAKSLMTGRFWSGPISSRPLLATLDTCVRQVQRGRPFTVMAHEPHMPTRQAKRYDSVGSRWRCTNVTTSSTVWFSRRGTL